MRKRFPKGWMDGNGRETFGNDKEIEEKASRINDNDV